MKLGFICDSPLLPTGYAKVARNLAVELQKLGNEITFCPIQYMGSPLKLDYGTVYEGDEYRSVIRYLDSVRPDAIVHVRDSFVMSPRYRGGENVSWLPDACRSKNIKFISYSPVHSSPLSYEEIRIAQQMVDYNITMTSWGRDIMGTQGVPQEKVDYLYHGVDRQIYKPLDRKKCRKELGLPPDKIIVGSVAVNYDFRKQIPLTMKAFQLLLRTVPDAHLVLWTEPAGFWDLEQWAVNLNIRNRVHFANHNASKSWGMSDEFMARLYSCVDLYVNTATSEGFGLPMLEALACGVPCVMTDNPVLREVYDRFGPAVAFVRSAKNFAIPWGAFEWLASPESAAEEMEMMLKEEHDSAVLASQISWQLDIYSWLRAAVKLDSILHDMVNGRWVHEDGRDWHLGWSMGHESFLREDILAGAIMAEWAQSKGRDACWFTETETEIGTRTGWTSVFLDIGAHAGRWSVRAARYYDRVIAVEPMHDALTVLLQNIELNGCAGKVDVRAVAISDKEGMLDINSYAVDGWNSVLQRSDAEAELLGVCQVPCTTLDRLVAATGCIPSLIKIDVEGHEREVIEGGKNVLSKYHPKLVIEIHNDQFVWQVESRLQEYGYTRFRNQKDSWHASTCTYMVAEK